MPFPEDLDQIVAWRNFGGKNAIEARALFAEDALNFSEDLMHMGLDGFRFYVHPFIEYLLSDEAEDDEEGLAGFVSVCELRFQFEADELGPLAEDLRAALRKLRPRAAQASAFFAGMDARIERLLN